MYGEVRSGFGHPARSNWLPYLWQGEDGPWYQRATYRTTRAEWKLFVFSGSRKSPRGVLHTALADRLLRPEVAP